jgi:hypothetical protein
MIFPILTLVLALALALIMGLFVELLNSFVFASSGGGHV